MKPKSKELEQLGKAIRKARETRDISQDNFAHEVGLGRSYYGSLERGEINASVMTLVKVARGLNVELKEIFPSILHS